MIDGVFLRRLFLLLNILIVFQDVGAQYKFNMSVSYNANCHGVRECEEAIRMCNSMVNGYMAKCRINFNSISECEAARGIVISGMNEVKSYANQVGVKFNFTVSPCSGSGGNFVFLGPSRGSSFYSPNFADEIKNWSEDYIEQQLALDPENAQTEPVAVETDDYSFDEERANLRDGFVIDTDKPFRSINVDEDGGINTHSDDFKNTEWAFIKRTHNLPDADANVYKARILSEANALMNDILEKNNVNRDELENYVQERFLFLNEFLLKENNRYMSERNILNKAFLLAKFKVEYKAILNQKYLDSVDEDYSTMEGAFFIANGKTREQYYDEELKKHEADLLKNGISQEDIDLIKSKTDKEAFVKDYSSTAKDIAEGAEHINNVTLSSKVISEILSGVTQGVTIGVIVNNLITIESYKIVSESLDKQIKSLDENFKKTDEAIKTMQNYNKNIDALLKYTATDGQSKVGKMKEKEGLQWAVNFDSIISDIKRQIDKNTGHESGNMRDKFEESTIFLKPHN